jgi:hypothetical protein
MPPSIKPCKQIVRIAIGIAFVPILLTPVSLLAALSLLVNLDQKIETFDDRERNHA